MAGRRLAVALPTTTPRLLPPSPTAPSGNVRRPSPSLASMLSGDFVNRPRYRCCCRLMHLKTASFLIGIADTLGMSAAFGRGLHLGLKMQHNPMAVSWFVISSLMFAFSFVCTLSMFYGVWRESYLWMVPKLVMKISAIVLYSLSTIGLVYVMMEHSQHLLDLVAEHVTKSDYEAARLALRTGGGGLAVGFLSMALIHVWWFYILYRCYKYLKDRYFWKRSRMMHSESSDNHVAAIITSVSMSTGSHFSEATTALQGATVSEQSRSRNMSTSDDINSAMVFSSAGHGRNGSVHRSISQDCDRRGSTINRLPLTSSNSYNTVVSDFDSVRLHELPPSFESCSGNSRQEDLVPCSCYSGTLPHSSSEHVGVWRGMNQTHV